MERGEIVDLILSALRAANMARTPEAQLDVSPSAPLFGAAGGLDSLGLVSLLIDVEEAFSDFQKLGSRSYLVISIVMVATVVATAGDGTIADARIAVGACSPVAQRLTQLESDLWGLGPTDRMEDLLTGKHLNGLAPIDDVRASAAYRLEATLALIGRSLRNFSESR